MWFYYFFICHLSSVTYSINKSQCQGDNKSKGYKAYPKLPCTLIHLNLFLYTKCHIQRYYLFYIHPQAFGLGIISVFCFNSNKLTITLDNKLHLGAAVGLPAVSSVFIHSRLIIDMIFSHTILEQNLPTFHFSINFLLLLRKF